MRTESDAPSINPAHTRAIWEAMAGRRFAVLTDLDGTISPLAPSPWQARISARCRQVLADLCGQVDLVAVVTGRAAVDARALVGLPEVVYVGNHGLETLIGDELEVLPSARRWMPVIATTLAAVAEEFAQLPGLYCENKGASASIHYRGTMAPAAARLAVLSHLAEMPRALDLRVSEGRMVIELRPPVDANKGTALRTLLDDWAIEGAIYLGDDTTDADAMRALQAWAARSGRMGVSFGVLSDETPSCVEQCADFTVLGVPAVLDLLSALVDLARARPKPSR